MQNVKQASKLKLFSTLLALSAMMLLFSCTKSISEFSNQANEEVTAVNQSPASANNNSLLAIPIEKTFFVPCANGGTGENVKLTGITNIVYQWTWNDHGFTALYHTNYQGVTGVGLTSGEKFVASGGIQGWVMGAWVNSQWIGTTIEQVRVIGKNTSFFIKYKLHHIVTPEGNISVDIDEETVECIM